MFQRFESPEGRWKAGPQMTGGQKHSAFLQNNRAFLRILAKCFVMGLYQGKYAWPPFFHLVSEPMCRKILTLLPLVNVFTSEVEYVSEMYSQRGFTAV